MFQNITVPIGNVKTTMALVYQQVDILTTNAIQILLISVNISKIQQIRIMKF